ncbi:ataxin-2-like protein [Antennarius striatus]|uniref:ataxin-2-like protein n=1 Tax=Antennarius striatus TaxID=241820 RepID=UPI0035B050D8
MHMTKKTRSTMKPPSQNQNQSAPLSSSMFEGVYNNARMLHFLTAVVGSTCDIRVKNGSSYEGVFKTLSSQCELAVDAVHKQSDGDGGGGGNRSTPPRIEEITDTMIFSPSDLVTMTCRDVDLSFAIRDTFTDTAISSGRVNGEHREKVLQRWEGNGNGENFDLESDTSNGWDANEMFRLNEEAYGIKSTYDSSLSMYTMPLEKGTSEAYRQREARAARLANEIEGSLQYRRRVSLENDDGRSEEDKFSSVVRDERSSPGFGAGGREGKYIPLPQRVRDGALPGGGVRPGGAARNASQAPSRHAPPSSSSPKQPSDRSSPLAVRTAYSPHQSQSSSPSASSPPCTNHVLPHSLSHPQALAEATRPPVNGVPSRTSPKALRLQNNRNQRPLNSQSSPAVSRPPKPDAPPQELPLVGPAFLDSSPSTVTTATTTKPSGPTPLFPIDVNEILNTAAKDRSDGLVAPPETKTTKPPSAQQRSQLEELRKFGKEFRLQPSSSPSASPTSADLPQNSSPSSTDSSSSSSSPTPPKPLPAPAQDAPQTPGATTPGPQPLGPEGPQQAPGSSEEASPEGGERSEVAAAAQVKNSTLNPNAKEFLPVKGNAALKPAPTPTPPRPTPPSPSVVLPPPGQPGGGGGGGGAIYSNPPGHYLSYVSPIHIQGPPLQAPQMYQYAMSTVNQGKFPRAKGPVVGPRPEHHPSPASPMLSAAASAAGPPLVASPYPQSYLQYGQVIPAMSPHYHGQAVYSMLQGGPRMLTSGAPPQPMGPPGPQYPGPAEGQPGPQQAMYAQSFSHHSASMHHPQPSSTPTGSQPPQHTAPSPGHTQSSQTGPQPPSMFHSGGLSAPTPPNLPTGHSSPQASYAMQGYGLPAHQALSHGFPSISQLSQAHVAGGMSGPHHSAGHGLPPVMLHYVPSQQGSGSTPQQGAPQHFYIGPPQAVQVQAHPAQQLSFHPSAN